MSLDISRHAQIMERLDELAATWRIQAEVLVNIVTVLETLRNLMNSPATLRDLAPYIESDVWIKAHLNQERSHQ